ncbi:MAG: rhomboid family intramembrane serine protease [Actinomycetota bacterium]
MSQYFSAMFRRRPNEGWFRIQQTDVTTVDILSGLAVFSMFVWAASRDLFSNLLFVAPSVREQYEVWRLVTWPIATGPNFFALLGIVFFWSFGQQLEGLFGRNRFLTWIASVVLVPSITLTVLGAFSDNLDITSASAGLSTLFISGIWVYAATYPNVRWFEIMPLWGLAAIFTGLNLLQFTGARAGGQILFMLLAIGAGLSVGRSLGLATAWPIPHIPIGGTPGGNSGGTKRKPKQKKPRSKPKRGDLGQRVVEGPWRGGDSMPQPPTSPPRMVADPADQAELDSLLDKIGSQGMDSLSPTEKARLNELSKKLRNR